MLLKPDSKFRTTWDVIVIGVMIVAAIQVPLSLVIDIKFNAVFLCIYITYFLVFSSDIYVQFNTGFYRAGKLVTSKREIAVRYFKGWFLIDFLTAIPFELIALSLPVYFNTEMPDTIEQGIKYLNPRIIRLFGLIRLAHMGQLFSFMRVWQHANKFNPSILRMSFSLFWLGMIAHWIALGWIALGKTDPALSAHVNYLRAFYWTSTTLTTIGYGDITPSTSWQMVYTIFVQLLGAGMFGYMIGNIASLLANVDISRTQFQERLEKLSNFMRSRSIPGNLQERIRAYHYYLWDTRRGSDEEEVLNQLPHNLRVEVALVLNSEIIQKVPLFQGAGEQLIRQIVLNLKPLLVLPGDIIFRKGEIGNEMYFISKGSVEIIDETSGDVYATIADGQFFGEIALLMSSPRTATVRAKDYCDLYVLDQITFERILEHYPEFAAQIRTMAELRNRTK